MTKKAKEIRNESSDAIGWVRGQAAQGGRGVRVWISAWGLGMVLILGVRSFLGKQARSVQFSSLFSLCMLGFPLYRPKDAAEKPGVG